MIRYHARYILPVTSPTLQSGCVAVEGDRIAYVGSSAGAPAGEDVDLGDAVLMPGLVNAHTHLELTCMRGFLEGLVFPRWIWRLSAAKRDVLDRGMQLDAARLGIDEGLRAGVTTFGDTGDAGVVIEAIQERGVRGIAYQEVFGPDPSQCVTALDELRAKVAAARALETPLVKVGVSPHAPYTVSDQLFSAVAALAREEALPIAVHIAESREEVQLVREGTGPFAEALRARGIAVAPRGRSPIELLHRLGVLSPRSLLIHCVHVDDGDIGTIAQGRGSVAHCPVSNAKLGHGIAPLAELLVAGVEVGLGSDSMISNNRMDLLEEARVALLLQRARHMSADLLSASAMVELATAGGARALGLGHEIGSLERGKAADLAAFSLQRTAPTYDPAAAAIFSAGTSASFVMVAGRVLVRNGELLHTDVTLKGRVESAARALTAWKARSDAAPHGAF